MPQHADTDKALFRRRRRPASAARSARRHRRRRRTTVISCGPCFRRRRTAAAAGLPSAAAGKPPRSADRASAAAGGGAGAVNGLVRAGGGAPGAGPGGGWLRGSRWAAAGARRGLAAGCPPGPQGQRYAAAPRHWQVHMMTRGESFRAAGRIVAADLPASRHRAGPAGCLESESASESAPCLVQCDLTWACQ
jgi:hypothetical protein